VVGLGRLFRLVALAVLYGVLLTLAYVCVSPFFMKLNPGIFLGDEVYVGLSRVLTTASSPSVDAEIPVFVRKPYVYFISSTLLWVAIAIAASIDGIPYVIARSKRKLLLAGATSTALSGVATTLLWSYPLKQATNYVEAVLTTIYFISYLTFELSLTYLSITLFLITTSTLLYRDAGVKATKPPPTKIQTP